MFTNDCMTYKITQWNSSLDLTQFYETARLKGFANNSSEKQMIASIAKEAEWNFWILYYNDIAVGSAGAHSFPEMGENAYRIATRTCVFTDKLPGNYGSALRTISVITKHQNPTSQFFIPTCIEWTPKNSTHYITTNMNTVGTQSAVHTIFAPALAKKGLLKYVDTITYRGTKQSVWQLYTEKFLEDLEKYPRWKLTNF